MNRILVLLFIAVLGMISREIAAEERPDDDIVQSHLREMGWSPTGDFEFHYVRNLLKAEMMIENKRLRQSNVIVLKTTKNFPGIASGVHNIDSVREYTVVNGANGPVLWGREIMPEEVQRREMEASGIPPEQMAEAMKAYSQGAMMLGEALRSEIAGSPMRGFMNSQLGFNYDMSPVVETPMDDEDGPPGGTFELVDTPERCQMWMESQALDEQTRARSRYADVEIKPWTSINPATFMMGPACMALFAYDVLSTVDDLDPAAAQQMYDAMSEAFGAFDVVGREGLGGRPTVRLRLEDLDLVQPLSSRTPDRQQGDDASSGYASAAAVYSYENEMPFVQAQSRSGSAGTFAINSMEIWIDTEYLVRRKMRMEGVMTENGESRETFMEVEYQDYRNIPDSALYMPHREIMRAGGVISEAQRAELAEAQQKMAEFEQQMASMPASQRAMMERMMGPQIEQMRNLVNNGAVEFTSTLVNVEINPDFRNPMLVEFAKGAGTGSGGGQTGNLLQQIQADLTTLGYEPGNVDGLLDTMTQVAISQYQAESGLAVTGQPSNELASALRVAVSQQ